jgi:hypothetical protein
MRAVILLAAFVSPSPPSLKGAWQRVHMTVDGEQ